MEHYINKDDIAVEIENRIKETESMQPKFDQFWAGQISAFKGILKILDTLEVKEEVYVVTRSEEHSDYVEAVFLNEDKAEEYCKPFNEDENRYARNITKVKIQ